MLETDCLSRFLFDGLQIRGERVHLTETWREVLARRDYPTEVRGVLGEAMAATALLATLMKSAGDLTLQIQSEGPLKLLVVQCDADGHLRALARFDPSSDASGLPDLSPGGTLAVTVQPEGGQRVQGVVSIERDHLAGALDRYFRDSVQLPTHFRLAADSGRVAGILVQKLPEGAPSDEDGWSRVATLTDSVSSRELLHLDTGTLLRRLYHEENVRLFEPTALSFECSCSRERIAEVLRGLGREEVDGVLRERDNVVVACEFCGAQYRFDAVDALALFTLPGESGSSSTLH